MSDTAQEKKILADAFRAAGAKLDGGADKPLHILGTEGDMRQMTMSANEMAKAVEDGDMFGRVFLKAVRGAAARADQPFAGACALLAEHLVTQGKSLAGPR